MFTSCFQPCREIVSTWCAAQIRRTPDGRQQANRVTRDNSALDRWMQRESKTARYPLLRASARQMLFPHNCSFHWTFSYPCLRRILTMSFSRGFTTVIGALFLSGGGFQVDLSTVSISKPRIMTADRVIISVAAKWRPGHMCLPPPKLLNAADGMFDFSSKEPSGFVLVPFVLCIESQGRRRLKHSRHHLRRSHDVCAAHGPDGQSKDWVTVLVAATKVKHSRCSLQRGAY